LIENSNKNYKNKLHNIMEQNNIIKNIENKLKQNKFEIVPVDKSNSIVIAYTNNIQNKTLDFIYTNNIDILTSDLSTIYL